MKAAATQMLRAARGDHLSQARFSKRLGYLSNAVGLWETGRRFPTAAVALRACKVGGTDLNEAFKKFRGGKSAPIESGTTEEVAAWMREVAGDLRIAEVARQTGVNADTISRWFKATYEPRLPQFLSYVEALTGRAHDLVACLVPIERVPALLPAFQRSETARRLKSELPESSFVRLALDSPAYAAMPFHTEGWIAERIGITTDTEAACLQGLAAAGLIEEVKGKWVNQVDQAIVHAARSSNPSNNPQRLHRIGLGLERATAIRPGDMYTEQLGLVTLEVFEELRAIHRNARAKVLAVQEAARARGDAGTRLVLANMQLVHWELD